jgi:iron complex outermembrane recepter protein
VPDWQVSMDSEYTMPIGENEGYVRGLFTYNPKISPEGGSNIAESYGILNLYAGLRSGSGGWEVSVWAKNVLDEEAITNISAVDSFNSRQSFGIDTGYNILSTTRPRELGVTVRMAFGGA